MGNLNFDATKVKPAAVAGSMLPVSDKTGHHVRITNTELKPVKGEDKKNCGFLELELTVVSGDHVNASGPYRLNLYNDNPKAVEIAYGQLSAICHVTGRYQVANHEDLRGAEFRAVVQLQKGDNPEGYTEVKGVKDLNGNDPGKSAPTQNQNQNQQNQQQNQQTNTSNTGGGFAGNQQQNTAGNAENAGWGAGQQQQQQQQNQQQNNSNNVANGGFQQQQQQDSPPWRAQQQQQQQ